MALDDDKLALDDDRLALDDDKLDLDDTSLQKLLDFGYGFIKVAPRMVLELG